MHLYFARNRPLRIKQNKIQSKYIRIDQPNTGNNIYKHTYQAKN